MKTIRLGILGCANIVEKFASALKEVPSCTLVAIASRDPQKAKSWAEKFSCSHEPSYDALLRRNDIDAVYIPLPIGLHKEWAVKAAKAGKHVLCEKSLAESYAAVQEMVSVCQEERVHLFENFMCDYHPQHEKVLSLMKSGEVGKVFLFEGMFGCPPFNPTNIRYSKILGGGALNDLGTYPLFMSRKLFKAEPKAVTCRLHFISGVDVRGSALVEFDQGREALISFGFNNFYQNKYSVWGETGIIHVKRAYSIPPTMRPEVELQKQGSIQNVEVAAANHFVFIIAAFCNAIGSGKKPDYAPLLSQARAMEALRLSAEGKRTVSLSEID